MSAAASTSKGLAVSDQASTRRLSDSATATRSVQARAHSDQHAEITKLRKWAAEAMAAGPPALSEPYADVCSEPMARRESDGGMSMKSGASSNSRMASAAAAAAAASAHGSPGGLALPSDSRDGSRRSFENATISAASFDRPWRLLPSSALQARPRTMFASAQEAAAAAAASSVADDDDNDDDDTAADNNDDNGAMRHPPGHRGLTECGSGTASLFTSSPVTTANSSPVKHQQQHQQQHLSSSSSSRALRTAHAPSFSPSSLAYSSPQTTMQASDLSSSPLRNRNTRGLQVGTLASSLQDDIAPHEHTPKPRRMSTSSPTTTVSTCDDESEEERPIMTPLDENGPRLGIDSPSRIQRSNAINHHGRPSHPPTRAGVPRRNAVSNDSPLHPLTSMGLSARRGSIPHTLSEDPRSDKYTSPSPLMGSGNKQIDSSPPPPLSQSTLLDLGQVNGITPPPLSQTSATGGNASSSSAADSSSTLGGAYSSVVSQGLEMGLGFSMASSALYTNLQGPAAGFASMAESRFSRSNGAGTMEMGALAMGLKMTDSELIKKSSEASASISGETGAGGGVLSEQAADEVTFAALNREEADLSRRRTTGGLAVKSRNDDIPVGRRRVVQRSGTHDPRNVGMAGNGHRLEMGHPNFSDLEEETSPPATADSRSPFDKHAAVASASASSSSGEASLSEAVASGRGSTQLDTPSIDHKAMVSPDASVASHLRNSYIGKGDLDASGVGNAKQAVAEGRQGPRLAKPSVPSDSVPVANNALLAPSGGGHFGPGVRAKILEVIDQLIESIPLTGEEGETVNIAEYGCLNSRSTQLLQPMISAFAHRALLRQPQVAGTPHPQSTVAADRTGFFGGSRDAAPPTIVGRGYPEGQTTSLNFSVTHEDGPSADFRSLMQVLETHPESYLDPHWQSTHKPALTNSIFNSFVARPFGCRIAPPNTMHLGFSLMDLQWSHTPANTSISPATMAQAELSTFLMARAQEFKKGSVFLMAYIARSEEDDVFGSTGDSTFARRRSQTVFGEAKSALADERKLSLASLTSRMRAEGSGHERHSSYSAQTRLDAESGATPRAVKKDIWTTLSNTLAPCIQRLVSCGMLKSDVARTLLHVPMHPRTRSQTQAVLKSVSHLWSVDWSCGLGETGVEGAAQLPESEPNTLRLPHPAWKAYQSGTLSRVAFSEHMIQLFKNLYESHFRHVLRERGKLTKGAVEFVLDSLWEVLYSRIVDQEPNSMQDVEIEVSLCALRRL